MPHGHLQATGYDAKGRKQYRYHPRWREVRDETKYGRMLVFGEALPRIRQQVEHDLALHGLPRAKVLATVLQLLETTLIRVGNEEYARANDSFGLTTLRDRHVDIAGATLRFHFRGKSGKDHTVEINDRRLALIVKRCQEIPGQELFQYRDDEGQRRTIDSADVNDIPTPGHRPGLYQQRFSHLERDGARRPGSSDLWRGRVSSSSEEGGRRSH